MTTGQTWAFVLGLVLLAVVLRGLDMPWWLNAFGVLVFAALVIMVTT